MRAASAILDEFGQPYQRTNGHTPRRELLDAMNLSDRNGRRNIAAKYDGADSTSDEYSAYWAKADRLSADAANSRSVREALVSHSRYEREANPHADGMLQSFADYVCGKNGPTLRMQTGSAGFNRMIEARWGQWAKIVQLRRKLHCMAEAKPGDGEAISILRNNPGLPGRIKLDIVLIETEQCQTPMLPFAEIGKIDGLQFDQFGNPEYYDVLKQHPGGPWNWMTAQSMIPEKIAARYVLHWFALRRPGLHRGVPETRSSLNVGASGRRMVEATTSAVENGASLGGAVLETDNPAWTPEEIAAGSAIDLKRRMMQVLPSGYKFHQMASEFPNAQFKDFFRLILSQQGRPLCMPHNLIAADSSDHNFASGRLDFIPFFLHLDVVRADGDDCVLDKIFAVWFAEAAREYGFFGDPDSPPAHSWDWPPHPVADQEADAAAKAKRLQTGQTTFTDHYAETGEDFEDVLPRMANDMFGDDEENAAIPDSQYKTQVLRNAAMRALLRNTTFNSKAEQASILQVEQNQDNSNDSPTRQKQKADQQADKQKQRTGSVPATTSARAAVEELFADKDFLKALAVKLTTSI